MQLGKLPSFQFMSILRIFISNSQGLDVLFSLQTPKQTYSSLICCQLGNDNDMIMVIISTKPVFVFNFISILTNMLSISRFTAVVGGSSKRKYYIDSE